jgi:hypothetical protein
VIWFLAAQAWLIFLFPMAMSALRLQPETTWQKLALLVALAWGFFPMITWLGAPSYLSHGHPAFWAPMIPLCDASSTAPLLTNAWLRRAIVSLLCVWFASETLWFSEKGAYAINPYVRPITALAVPLLLQPAVVWGHFEGFVANPVGRLLSTAAPYSMGFFLWQGIAASLDMRVQKAVPPWPRKATLYKLGMLAAISYASLHLLERPLNGAFKRLLSSRPGPGGGQALQWPRDGVSWRPILVCLGTQHTLSARRTVLQRTFAPRCSPYGSARCGNSAA